MKMWTITTATAMEIKTIAPIIIETLTIAIAPVAPVAPIITTTTIRIPTIRIPTITKITTKITTITTIITIITTTITKTTITITITITNPVVGHSVHEIINQQIPVRSSNDNSLVTSPLTIALPILVAPPLRVPMDA